MSATGPGCRNSAASCPVADTAPGFGRVAAPAVTHSFGRPNAMHVESVHVYTFIFSALSSVFAAFFLSSLLSSKLLRLAIGIRGTAAYAIVCTVALLTFSAVIGSLGMSPVGLAVALLLGLFFMHFVLTKKLVPRLVRRSAGPSDRSDLPSAMRISIVSAPISAVFLLLAGLAVSAFVFAAGP